MSEGSWRTAFLRQAYSDFVMFQKLHVAEQIPSCHALHFFQMATEKLAKALMATKLDPPPRTHHAFLKFLRICRSDSDLMQTFQMKSAQYRSYIQSLLPLAQQIEMLAPASAGLNLPNPEYPWQAGSNIIAPADYPFNQYNLDNPKWIK